jgi:SAM-dependent methyltransferase
MADSKRHSTWDRGDYEQIGSRIHELSVRLVDTVERRMGGLAGISVLDLACGTGNASLEAARRGAAVLGTDLAEGLLRQADHKARAEQLDVRWEVADASDTGLAAGAFDVVMSSVGLVMVTEQAKAVAEIARVVRPGGLVAWTAWCRQPDNPFGAPLHAFHGPPAPEAQAIYDWADVDKVSGWLRSAFTDIALETWDFFWRFPDVETPMRLVLEESPMHLAAWESVRVHDRPALRQLFEAAFESHRKPDGTVEFANPYVVVSATRR